MLYLIGMQNEGHTIFHFLFHFLSFFHGSLGFHAILTCKKDNIYVTKYIFIVTIKGCIQECYLVTFYVALVC